MVLLCRSCTEFDRGSTGSTTKQDSQIDQICEMCRCDPEENFRLGDIVTELKISNSTVMLFFSYFYPELNLN